ncbi:hypothetical protein [Streptomyces sp. 900105245]
MPALKPTFKTNVNSIAEFDGVVEPDGPTRYRFSGTLKASCQLFRGNESFHNTVRLGHGATSDDYTYLEYEIVGSAENTWQVEGSGTRKANETVDFHVGVNDGLSGQFDYGSSVTVPPGGPKQKIAPVYMVNDPYGETKYDVRADGTVRADGPTGYVIECEFSAYDGPGTMTDQSATFGWKTSSGKWEYKSSYCKDTPTTFTIRGTRKSGENVQVIVGATSKVLNLYGYGEEVDTALPENF